MTRRLQGGWGGSACRQHQWGRDSLARRWTKLGLATQQGEGGGGRVLGEAARLAGRWVGGERGGCLCRYPRGACLPGGAFHAELIPVEQSHHLVMRLLSPSPLRWLPCKTKNSRQQPHRHQGRRARQRHRRGHQCRRRGHQCRRRHLQCRPQGLRCRRRGLLQSHKKEKGRSVSTRSAPRRGPAPCRPTQGSRQRSGGSSFQGGTVEQQAHVLKVSGSSLGTALTSGAADASFPTAGDTCRRIQGAGTRWLECEVA